MSERIEKLRICNRKGIHTCRLGSIHLNEREAGILTEYLTQLEAERDEAVAEAIVNERERISKWASLSLKLNYGRANWVSYDNLLDAIAYPSDINSEGNSK